MGKRKSLSLSKGRPPLLKQNTSLSAKATRSIIRKHHNLLKSQSQAQKAGDTTISSRIAEEIARNGGIEKYQMASQIGQSTVRGGDTSKILKTWLEEAGTLVKNCAIRPISVLEVGCVSPNNLIASCKNVQIVRTDLHSSHPSILQEDFMLRPTPISEADRFNLISLSLVLNYVATPCERGDMLLRTRQFLRSTIVTSAPEVFPALFLTLPLPCVSNSRYMTVDHLVIVMSSLGYKLVNSKSTSKIYYSLWHCEPKDLAGHMHFKKGEINPGPGRNNFAVVIR